MNARWFVAVLLTVFTGVAAAQQGTVPTTETALGSVRISRSVKADGKDLKAGTYTVYLEIAREHGAHDFQWAASPEERATLWTARHNAYYATVASRPEARAWTTDVCVPISRLAECITDTDADNHTASFPVCLVGHAGDGNFHLIFPLDPNDPAELEKAEYVNARLIERALAVGGTCSGEHGVGLGKMAYLPREHGEALEVMKTIKRALDPDNRMNPGKMLQL